MSDIEKQSHSKPATQTRSDTLSHWVQTILWFGLFIVCFEIGIRFFVIKPPLMELKPGWGLVAQANEYEVVGFEGYGVTHYDENGEVRSPYTDGTSVVVLGDSTTKGAEVSETEKYVNLTEQILRKRGVKADLHNLGLPERTIADSVYQAPAVIEAYDPKVVVVQANLNSFEMSLETDRTNHFVFDKTGNIQLVHLDEQTNLTRHNLVASSGLLSFTAYRWRFIHASLITSYPALFSKDAATDGGGSGQGAQASNIVGEKNKFGAMLSALKQAYPNSKIVILVISQVPKVPLDRNQSLVWSTTEDNLLVTGLQQALDLVIVYPNKAFQQRYEEIKVLPRGFLNSPPNLGHLNKYGNEVVANVLADALEEILR